MKPRFKPLLISSVCSLMLLNACSSGSDSSDENTVETPTVASTEEQVADEQIEDNEVASTSTETNQQSSSIADRYVGSYASTCKTVNSFGLTFSENFFQVFTEDTRTRINTVYDDENCTVNPLEEMAVFSVEYTGDVITTNLGEADIFSETLVARTSNGSLVDVENDTPEFRAIRLDGINLFITDGSAETPADVSDFLVESEALTRQ